MSGHPKSTLTLDAGGTPWTVDLGKPDEYGESEYSGNVYLSTDGQLYGSIFVYLNEAGEPIITIGQYNPQTQEWEPRDNLRPELTNLTGAASGASE
ncbi:hypothetical protein LT337_32860 (plasmid) [Mycolicibacterium fortuitum]|nr:hypothetical protein LT337_32860 [Mycolicibacterium fortuitum]